jgi:hypothetical protein
MWQLIEYGREHNVVGFSFSKCHQECKKNKTDIINRKKRTREFDMQARSEGYMSLSNGDAFFQAFFDLAEFSFQIF